MRDGSATTIFHMMQRLDGYRLVFDFVGGSKLLKIAMEKKDGSITRERFLTLHQLTVQGLGYTLLDMEETL